MLALTVLLAALQVVFLDTVPRTTAGTSIPIAGTVSVDGVRGHARGAGDDHPRGPPLQRDGVRRAGDAHGRDGARDEPRIAVDVAAGKVLWRAASIGE